MAFVISENVLAYMSTEFQAIYREYIAQYKTSGSKEDFNRYIPFNLTGWESEVSRVVAGQRNQSQLQDEARKRSIAYNKTYTSFSGADIVASIRTAGGKPIVFGEIQTISYSIYRPVVPVTTLGRINPKGVVRGPRTIAGTMIFTVFDRHVLKQVMDTYKAKDSTFRNSYGLTEEDIIDLRTYAKTDEMPPFDINVSFMNEYGNSASLNIYGIYILTEGQTMSIEDMITENTMQYLAMDIDLMDYGADASSSVNGKK